MVLKWASKAEWQKKYLHTYVNIGAEIENTFGELIVNVRLAGSHKLMNTFNNKASFPLELPCTEYDDEEHFPAHHP